MEVWCRKTKGTCGNDKYSNRKLLMFLCVIFWEILIFLHRVSIPFASNGIFIEKEAGYYKIFSDELGFVVKIDISGNIQILLQEKHYNKTCGLCGNFNKFAEDDFRTQEGKTTTNCIFSVHFAHLSWWVIQQIFCWSSKAFPPNLSGVSSSCAEKPSDSVLSSLFVLKGNCFHISFLSKAKKSEFNTLENLGSWIILQI